MPVRRFETVAIDRCVPHPDNSNEMDQRTRDRVRRHIAETGRYPAPIVRSLEESVEFADLHAQDRLQFLDGQHRWEILSDLGRTSIDVDIWGGITDASALILLATLNHGGDDNPIKRAALISRVVRTLEEDADHLELYLPENAGDIRKYAGLSDQERKLVSFQAAGPGQGGKREARAQGASCIEIFVPNRASERLVRAKLDEWLKLNDPQRRMPYRDGVALMALMGVPVG